ncbi:MAG: hypothetical protein LBC28_05140 [Oscillospiraceae bacterium]|nr:hypothetical protein [Oscillospiraceae bacterium]
MGVRTSSELATLQIGGVTLVLDAHRIKEIFTQPDADSVKRGKVTIRGEDLPVLNPAGNLGLTLNCESGVTFFIIENERSFGDDDRTSALAIDGGKVWMFQYVGVGIAKPCDPSNPFAPYAYESWGEAPDQYVFPDFWAASGEAPEKWSWE